MKTIKILLALTLSLLTGSTAIRAEQADGLVLHYDFEGVSGTQVADHSGSGVTARLMNQASVVEMGRYHVLSLGNGSGYLDMSSAAGNVVRDLADFTVSVYYRVDEAASLSGAGYFLWAFSQSAANTQTSAPYTAYRLNVQRMATSTGGWGSETGFEVGSESAKGSWIHMLYRQTGNRGQLYLNGKLAGTNTSMPVLAEAFTAAPAYCWIGRAPFASDNYLRGTLVYDFRLYNRAVDDDELAALSAVGADLDYEFSYGTPGDFAALRTELEASRAFLASAADGYPANALAELADQVNMAQTEADAGRISQTLIDSRLAALTAALAVAKASAGFDMGTASVPSSLDHGFVHPGGLHTQADFDRIKQLLADGDPTITAAFNALRSGEYAQSGIATWPTETVWRSGSGDNYMNAARGAAMAYQNALVWKIAGTRANADGAVRILMQWARQNKYVSGNTNLSLAAGLYGYAFAQAAELVRDYEGWSRADFDEFKDYIRRTWYPATNDFLRRRHDTWLNAANGSNGQRPGHYWSNWGLCCTLAMMSYGILLDDVHMYNQGVSFFKYDHVGSFPADQCVNRTADVQNWGLNEFLGNLVPVVYDDARGPYGRLGQMQESGRDAGHEQMAAGLAVDIAQVAYNQGDDLFAYMDHRLAAGLEYVAAHNFGGQGSTLPWTNYAYAECRAAWHNAWVQTGHEDRAESRPYWDRVVGHYEGVKGVKMQYAEMAAKALRGTAGYDMGGHSYGETSGGYDHLGFSTLTCYRPAMADPALAPLEISGKIEYKGQTLDQTELGGLKYTFVAEPTHAVAADGADIRLIPVLPDGVEDNGSWQWNTGQTTREITVKADHSYIYRVCYTTDAGTPSYRSFSIAVAGDCSADIISPEITVDGVIYPDTVKEVLYGKSVILYTGNSGGYTNDYKWDNGSTASSVIVIPNITSSRDYVCHYVNVGGYVSEQRFRLNVVPAIGHITVGTTTTDAASAVVGAGQSVTLSLTIPGVVIPTDVVWADGTTGTSYTIDNVQTSADYTAELTVGGEPVQFVFSLYVPAESTLELEDGDYQIRHAASDTYLTNLGDGSTPVFRPLDEDNAKAQTWVLYHTTRPVYSFRSALDSLYLTRTGTMSARSTLRSFYLQQAEGTSLVAIYSGTATHTYWTTNADGSYNPEGSTTLTAFPYELIPAETVPTAIGHITDDEAAPAATIRRVEYFTPDGRRLHAPQPGIILRRTIYQDGTVRTEKRMNNEK